MAHFPDFNGDGTSDILWQRDDGALTFWNGTGDSNGFDGDTIYLAFPDAGWTVAGTGDLNADGASDILFRDTDGTVTFWNGTASGFDESTEFSEQVGLEWEISALGDVNGDDADDIVWRKDDGELTVWLASENGFDGASYGSAYVDTAWEIAGMGDFDGDGVDEAFWQNADGSVNSSDANGFEASNSASGNPDWQVEGIADFTGDGREDVLVRDDTGAVSVLVSLGDGTFSEDLFVGSQAVEAAWQIEGTGDYNLDGQADILWQKDDGETTYWQSNGVSFDGDVAFHEYVDTSWDIVNGGTSSVLADDMIVA